MAESLSTTSRRRLLALFAAAVPATVLAAQAAVPASATVAPTDIPPPSFDELNQRGMSGIEASACLIEIRLALNEYRHRHGKDHWRLFLAPEGRAN